MASWCDPIALVLPLLTSFLSGHLISFQMSTDPQGGAEVKPNRSLTPLGNLPMPAFTLGHLAIIDLFSLR